MNYWLFNDQLDEDVAKMIFNDEFYGLKYPNNYAKWDPLMKDADPVQK